MKSDSQRREVVILVLDHADIMFFSFPALGRSVIPKSKTESRIKANLEGDFKLEAADVERIDKIDKKLRFNDPSGAFGWDFYTDLDGKKQ